MPAMMAAPAFFRDMAHEEECAEAGHDEIEKYCEIAARQCPGNCGDGKMQKTGEVGEYHPRPEGRAEPRIEERGCMIDKKRLTYPPEIIMYGREKVGGNVIVETVDRTIEPENKRVCEDAGDDNIQCRRYQAGPWHIVGGRLYFYWSISYGSLFLFSFCHDSPFQAHYSIVIGARNGGHIPPERKATEPYPIRTPRA